MTPDFVEDEYNPRRRIPDYASVFARWSALAEAARSAVPMRELRYGPSTAETLDFFPPCVSDAPLLVFLHGGYWRALDKRDFSWLAPPYIRAGAAVAIINYALAPAVPLERIVAQVRRALAWLSHNAPRLGIDSDRIVCSGHSAGGHLTAMMWMDEAPADTSSPRIALNPARPASGLALSGLFDLRPLLHAPFLKEDLSLTPERAASLSPALLKPDQAARLLLAVGAEESDEFHRQSIQLKCAWPAAIVEGPLSIPGANHFTVCDALATPDNSLFESCLRLLGVTN